MTYFIYSIFIVPPHIRTVLILFVLHRSVLTMITLLELHHSVFIAFIVRSLLVVQSERKVIAPYIITSKEKIISIYLTPTYADWLGL